MKVRRQIVFNHPSLFSHERQRQLRNFRALGNRSFAEHGPTQAGVYACMSGRWWGEGELGGVRKVVGEAYKPEKGIVVGWEESARVFAVLGQKPPCTEKIKIFTVAETTFVVDKKIITCPFL